MSNIRITEFRAISIPRPSMITAGDVQVTLANDHRAVDLELTATPYYLDIDSSSISIRPDRVWIPGTSIEIYLAGSRYKDTFIVQSDGLYYDPEQRLYSLSLSGAETPEDLVRLGLATVDEVSLLQSMGPQLQGCFDNVSSILYAPLTYKGYKSSKLAVRVVAFRMMQQLAFMLGLDALVESILLSPGPVRDWFRKATIAGALSDAEVLQNLLKVEKTIAALRNNITLNNLNTTVIDSVALQVDPSTEYFKLATTLVTLFCGIRYTHDNNKFSY